MSQLAQDRCLNRMRNAFAKSSYPADWYIEDNEKVSQDVDHQEDEFILQSTLLAWKKRTNQDSLLVGCELACRWDEVEYRVGVAPDVYVVERPPGDETGYIGSLKTWLTGNHPPILAIEVVSKSRPKKDYKYSPEKHDLLGTFELWVFDPHLYGYTETQPPALLQVFQRETNNVLAQRYAGAGPYWSDALDAWVMVIDGDLVIANDRDGKDRWPTLEEEQRLRAEAERVAKENALERADAERVAKENALERADAERVAKEDALKRADAERVAKEDALKRADAERVAKEDALARLAQLEALLSKKS
jgi:Uma2 family endonuclease